MEEKDFVKLRLQLGSPEEEPLSCLLERVENALAGSPDDPEMAFYHAELLHRLKKESEAKQAYHKVISIVSSRSEQRHNELITPLQKNIRRLKFRFTATLLFIIVFVSGLIAYPFYQLSDNAETQAANRYNSSFIRWLIENQLVRLCSAAKGERCGSDIFLQSGTYQNLTISGRIQFIFGRKKLPKYNNWPDKFEDEENDVIPSLFQCSVELIRCSPDDIPQKIGNSQSNTSTFEQIASDYMISTKDCEGVSQLIKLHEEKIGWSIKDKSTKTYLENQAIALSKHNFRVE